MSSDFTLDKYSELCSSLIKNYEVVRICDFLMAPSDDDIVLLRHDVDKYPDRALRMASLEAEHDIFSTYYFRMVPEIFVPDIIKEIEEMGHEIGYHYEVMDKTDGSLSEAIEIFGQDLIQLREIADVKTACMHGSVMKKWKNLDIWDRCELSDFDLIGEPYLSLDFSKMAYYTDTGRRWDGCAIDDCVEGNIAHPVKVTNGLIKIIDEQVFDKMMILTHPQRWCEKGSEWTKELVGQNIKNVGKRIIKRGRQ